MTITYVQARDAVISHLHINWSASYPSVPVFYENLESIDLDSVGPAFLKAELEFHDAEQASIETAPTTRVRGLLHIAIMARAGTGTRTGMSYYDFLFWLFKHRNLSGVQVETPTPGHRETHDGWHMQQISIPFSFLA